MSPFSNVSEPTSLKTALDFAGALKHHWSSLQSRVGNTIDGSVQDISENFNVSTNLNRLLENLELLRAKLVNQYQNFGRYDNLSPSSNFLATTVSEFLPKLYCTLSYFDFNVNGKDCGGGEWVKENCRSGNFRSWLQASNGILSASSSKAAIWPGGFREVELQCTDVNGIKNELNGCVGDACPEFPILLSAILFYNPSFPALSATALVFVKEFCFIVCGDDTQDEEDEEEEEDEAEEEESRAQLHKTFRVRYETKFPEYVALKQCCESVKSSIELLIGKGSGKDENVLLHIPRNSHKLYEKKLQSDNFDKYIEWLAENLKSFITNLQQMHSDCKTWNPSDMSKGNSAGPFPYGFGFPKSGSWKQEEVQSTIIKLIGDNSNTGLKKLHSFVTTLKSLRELSGSFGSGIASTWNTGSSEPESDGPRKPASSGSASVPPPKSLKDALDFAGALLKNSSNIKDLVGKELEDRVAKTLGLRTAPKSVAGNDDSTTISQNFEKVLDNLKELRKLIVDDSHQGSFGSYDSLKRSSHDISCVELCVKSILAIMPRLYATLNFLYFKVEDHNDQMGGSGWMDQTCNGSDGLGTWFKGKTEMPSASDSNTKLLSGGYNASILSKKRGSDLEATLQKLVSDSGGGDGKCLHHLLLDVVTVTESSPCNTATQLATLAALCDASSSTFRKEVSKNGSIDGVFKTVIDILKLFAPCNDGEDNALLVSLFDGSPLKYSTVFNAEAFNGYMEWLNRDLDRLIASLKSLSTASANWSAQALHKAEFSGPFGYGFSFSEQWDMQWKSEVQRRIPSAVDRLTNVLTQLTDVLKKSFNHSESYEHSSSEAGSSGTGTASGGVGGIGEGRHTEPQPRRETQGAGVGGRGGGDGGAQTYSSSTTTAVSDSGRHESPSPQDSRDDKSETGEQGHRGDISASSSAASTTPPSSSAGAITGTLTTVVFGGGAAAVYFNVGGVCTILKGILGLH
ncbi:secreted antigen 1 [Babesia caballi]|uniref:Secreted antigen 1 n=1 Tax=Babesia caballi TaxID=5871 RepID=A0AAV4M2Z3_BABCB|nr:secreted antigen 1 [Babesia caballi]